MQNFSNIRKSRFFLSALIIFLSFPQGFSLHGFKFPKNLDEKYKEEMHQDASQEEKRERVIVLLRHDIPMMHIMPIVHMSNLSIKKIAKEEGIRTIKPTIKGYQPSEALVPFMEEMPKDSSTEEKHQRAIILLKAGVPVNEIQFVVHMTSLSIKKIAEKEGIQVRENIKNKFQPSEALVPFMEEMPKDSSQEEKCQRAIVLLKEGVPVTEIQFVVHMTSLDIKKIAEKEGIQLRENKKLKFQPSEAFVPFMEEMPKDSSQEEKCQRAIILLKEGVPVNEIEFIAHMSPLTIKKIAEKEGIQVRETKKKFQPLEALVPFMEEMSKDSPVEKKHQRAMILLKAGVPVSEIQFIVHMGPLDIKKIAEKEGIQLRENKKLKFQPSEVLVPFMEEMSKDSTPEEKRQRAMILLKAGVPVSEIQFIVHMGPLDIKKIAEKEGIQLRENKKLKFQPSEALVPFMEEILKDSSLEEKQQRAMILLKSGVPLWKIESIVHMGSLSIKKLAEKEGIQLRKRENKFESSEDVSSLMNEISVENSSHSEESSSE